ncbi:MAG: tRNA (adenosine(37)-N6)-dimethylallyltransferase MiaA [Bacteroidota bacterium]|nr:tRNA (adenosine(37)-N6)-dimethylallyltransferase MiaA [Bacteroidota bacterium]
MVILGPTASGKTKLAAQLAYRLNGEIISADSRQVYRDMNIGTGKDYPDYMVNGTKIPCHLIDIADAGTRYNLHQFTLDFKIAFDAIVLNNRLPILCGGTGLYIQAALSNLAFTKIPVDKQLRIELAQMDLVQLKHLFTKLGPTPYSNLADLSTAKRCIRAIEISRHLLSNPHFIQNEPNELKPLIIGLNPSLPLRRKRIAERLSERRTKGLIDEIEGLLKMGIDPAMFEYYGLEYKFVWRFLNGQMSEVALFELLEIAIQQYAKRQMTFFRKLEKDGMLINWIDGDLPIAAQIEECLKLINAADFKSPDN